MNIYSTAQIRDWDAFTIQHEPINSIDLMERAAASIVNKITGSGHQPPFWIFCGPGNNGGDGLAVARMLHLLGLKLKVFLLEAGRYSADCRQNLERLRETGLPVLMIDGAEDFPLLPKGSFVIDALYGTGLGRPLTGTAALLVQHLNAAAAYIISIDMPSGLFADKSSGGNTIVHATETWSFQAPKLAFMLPENGPFVGNWQLLDIQLHPGFEAGTSPAAYYLEAAMVQPLIRKRTGFSHKYNYGHALLFAGSPGMLGAGILCAKACMRSGAGLVSIAVEPGYLSVYQVAVPEAICIINWKEEKIFEKKTAIGIGPGWKPDGDYAGATHQVFSQNKIPLLADATAIQWLSEEGNQPYPGLIITPHEGEFDKCFGKSANDFERIQLARERAKTLGIYIVLKGAHTLIATPEGAAYFNSTGNPGMAKAGSGDVLTGILTGLLAQGYPPLETCILGVYLHGLAGDLAARAHTVYAMTAMDIVDHIGEAWKKLVISL